jgi:arylsulfatase A-like enzyme
MLLRYALVFGTLGGLAEAVYVSVRHLIRHQLAAWYSPDVLWMAPLSSTFVYLGIAVCAGVVLHVTRRRLPVGLTTFALAFPPLYGLTQLPGFSLHRAAEILLALGAAVALARALEARDAAAGRWMRRVAPAVTLLLVLLTAWGLWHLPSERERRAMAGLPDAAADATNVLFIILDTVRAANLSLYGYERATSPSLDAWAASGVVFERAIATAPWTLPSHASMFTGQYNFEARTGFSRRLDRRHATLAEVLAAHGYATAGFTANLGYTTRASGLHRGFARYEDFPVTPGMFVSQSWVARQVGRFLGRLPGYPTWSVPKTAEYITDQFQAWLDNGGDRPFFVFLNYYDAHSPYRGPAEYRARFGLPAEEEFSQDRPYTTMELQPWINAYDGSIAYIDDQLRRVFQLLEARDLRDNTLIVITSDHGEMFGEHGQIEHTSGLHLPVLHVPLVMAQPGRLPQGVRVAQPVSLRDLPATVLDVIGIRNGASIPGESLANAWTGEAYSHSPLLSEFDHYDWAQPWMPIHRGDMKSLVEGPLHYIRNGDGTEELYDMLRDPAALRDISGSQTPSLGRLRFALDSIFR